jgi:hypothetical protein
VFGNLHNQVETMRVEDIAWCRSRISVLEKPNNPANKSLWTLVNLLVRRVDDQADQIKDLKAGLAIGGERVSVLEMSSSMIRSRVSVLEEAMEINPPVTDLSGDDDSTDSEYADVTRGKGWCPDPVHHKYIARKWTKDLANTHPEYSKDIQNFPSQFNRNVPSLGSVQAIHSVPR